MKRIIQMGVFLIAAVFIAGPAMAQDLFIYPTKGQSNDQMERDKFECYRWAKDQTGFDPMQQPRATAPPPQQEARQGGLLRGAGRGAAVGAVGGAIGGNAGRGAAVGAASGALIGGMRRRDQAQRQAQAEQRWAEEQAAIYRQSRGNYDRAFAACLEGRGYTVK